MNTKLSVSITQNYRLTTDNTQFILQRRHLVDPTKSPAYKAEEHNSPPEPYETWKDAGFYPLNSSGITSAAQVAILRDTDVSQAETLADALRMYAAETAKLAGLIDAALRIADAKSDRCNRRVGRAVGLMEGYGGKALKSSGKKA